jgi:23S rRNA pseudouridine1911/1915/1917 synthase
MRATFLIQSGAIISTDLDSEDVEEGVDAGADVELRELFVQEGQHGQRLDRVLVEINPEFSRSYLQQLVAADAVTLNGQSSMKVATRVKAGDRVVLELRPTPQSQAFKPEPMPLSVVFEDEHLLVINKPVGLVVHPAPGNWSGTLLNGLLARYPGAANVPRAGIVHRLDKDTSGLMVVAKTRAAMDCLVNMIASRDVSRQYLALGHAPWFGPVQQEIDAPVGRDPRNRLRMAVVDLKKNAGKEARTTCRMLGTTEQACLVLCALHTGRTHQIRVHMAFVGHPLLADKLYGGNACAGMQRQALHALRLSFVHPVTQENKLFMVDPPDDFASALTILGLSYNPVQGP